MHRRKLPFNSLRAFEAAARHLSVSGAARELSVTHSAVSHQIRLLEDDLGLRLFERNNRGLRLTAEGEALAPVLADGFDRIGSALDQLRRSDPASSIRISSTPTFAAKWLVPRLRDWYVDASAARISLQPSLDFVDLRGDGFDFAIRCGVPPWDDLQHDLLMPIHLVPVCSPAYAEQHESIEKPADVLRHDLIHADIGDHGQGQEWRAWLGDNGVDCPADLPGLSFHDPALAMQAAADGLGLAIGYLELIDRDLQDGNLVTAATTSVRHEYGYYLVYPVDPELSPRLAGFREWILAQAG
ncbi:MAG: LysR substrate-binding domain-containing protein [Gammaproteobacteria bacterium]|nr:LysR substrate-binding domain-containing protein [Gammaproteobacteria bacterium]